MNKEEQAKYIIQQLGIKLPDNFIGNKYGEDEDDDEIDDLIPIPLEVEREVLSFIDIKNKKDVKSILNYASMNKTSLKRYIYGGNIVEGLKSSIIYEFVDIYKMFNGDFTKGDTEFIRSVSYVNEQYGVLKLIEFLEKKSTDKNKLIYLKFTGDDYDNKFDKFIQTIENIKELEIKYLYDTKYFKNMNRIKKLNVDVYMGPVDDFKFKTLETLKIGSLKIDIGIHDFYLNLITNNNNLKEIKIDNHSIEIKTLKLFKNIKNIQCIFQNVNDFDILFETDDDYVWHELDITIKHNGTNFEKIKKNFSDFLKNIKTLKTLKIKTDPNPHLQDQHIQPLYLEDLGFTTKNLNIEYLKIQDSLIKDDDLYKLNNLKYLKLVNNVIPKINDFLYLNLKTVKYLYYEYKKSQDSDNYNLLLTLFKNLDTLILKNIIFDDDNIFKKTNFSFDNILMVKEESNFEKYQNTFENVKILELYNCHVNIIIYKYLKNIQELSVVSNSNKSKSFGFKSKSYDITTDALIFILKNTNIKKLTLINCSGVDERIFKYINRLKYLCIENCKYISEDILDFVHEDTVFKFVLHDIQKNGPKTRKDISYIKYKKLTQQFLDNIGDY
jgi:hypothetical protein